MENKETYKGILRITLKSDCACGTGFSYAGVIDSDIAYDASGIPVIYGRRLKGCMCETALTTALIPSQNLDDYFGKRRFNDVTGIIIGNAYPLGTEGIRAFPVQSISEQDQDKLAYLAPNRVLDLFTTVRAQTKINAETGVADDKTLRFERVVNHYSYDQKSEMVFEAPVLFRGTKAQRERLELVAKATRNIGMNRTRGLGSITMTLTWDKEPSQDHSQIIQPEKSGISGLKRIRYCIRNTEPLVISSQKKSESQNFINGASVLGVLASTYLKTVKDASADTEEFADLFLKGKAHYSNLYITQYFDKDWIDYEPVPYYINRLKKTKCLVNVAVTKNWDSKDPSSYNPENGNQPKKLDYFYLCRSKEGSIRLMETSLIQTYHHSQTASPNDQDKGLLYSSVAIEAGQYFSGEILVDAEYAEFMESLLIRADLRFGQSKTAQYGKCELVDHKITNAADRIRLDTATDKKQIVITFLSDAAFMTENGSYTIKADEIAAIISSEIIPEPISEAVKAEYQTGFISPCEITGYNSKWNLKKPAIPGITKGSALIFSITGNITEIPAYIGAKTIEGYGKIRVDILDNMTYELKQDKSGNAGTEDFSALISGDSSVRKIYKEILVRNLVREISGKNITGNSRITITASALGRLTLMLEESMEENKEDSWKQFESLGKRICSIKSESVKKAITAFLNNLLGTNIIDTIRQIEALENQEDDKPSLSLPEIKENTISNVSNKFNNENTTAVRLLHELYPEEAELLIFKAAFPFLKSVLTYQKYLVKEDV